MGFWILVSLLFTLLVLTIFSCIFSGGETSITVASPVKLNKLKLEGHKEADLVLQLKDRKEEIISSILLGNNLVNMLASSVSTFLAVWLFGPFGVLISTLVMTALVLVFA